MRGFSPFFHAADPQAHMQTHRYVKECTSLRLSVALEHEMVVGVDLCGRRWRYSLRLCRNSLFPSFVILMHGSSLVNPSDCISGSPFRRHSFPVFGSVSNCAFPVHGTSQGMHKLAQKEALVSRWRNCVVRRKGTEKDARIAVRVCNQKRIRECLQSSV